MKLSFYKCWVVSLLLISSLCAAEEQEEIKFYVGEFQIRGNTLLSPIEIESALYRYLGEDKTIQDIETARRSLEDRYRNGGYPTVLVNIPEQDVESAVVTFDVVEGRVDSLRVVGSRYFSLENIKQQVPSLAEGSIPYLPQVKEELNQINRQTPDRSTQPMMRPGGVPGTIDVELRVQDTFPLHGYVEVNNHHAKDTTDTRVIGQVRYDNLWQLGHSLSVQYQTAPENADEVRVLSSTYLWRSQKNSNLLAIYGVHSESNTATVGSTVVIGEGDILGLRVVNPLSAGGGYYHSVSAGFDFKDFKESILQGADTLNTPMKYVNWAFQYNLSTQAQKSSTDYGLGANFGIRGLGNDQQEFDDKRAGSKPNYLYLHGEYERKQLFLASSQLVFSLKAQLTESPLISNEQFSAGGADSVRGYYESQALGDDGIVVNLEWYTPSILNEKVKHLDDLRFVIFADAATLWVRDALPSQQNKFELYGAGLGLRLGAWQSVSLKLDWAVALHESGDVKKDDDMVHARLNVDF